MQNKRFVVELGTGADLHGADMTKAAVRAVKDAISTTIVLVFFIFSINSFPSFVLGSFEYKP